MKFENSTYLVYNLDGPEGEATVKGLIKRLIPGKIAKRVKKIVYIPTIYSNTVKDNLKTVDEFIGI